MQDPNLYCDPAVCVAGDDYIIVVCSRTDMTVWITVGDDIFYDDNNGMMNSLSPIHKIPVPSYVLDHAGEYTVNYRIIEEIHPYYSKDDIREAVSVRYNFFPLKSDTVDFYSVSDVHERIDLAAACADRCPLNKDIYLINGDITNDMTSMDKVLKRYILASDLAHGEKPCIITRGNHEIRGQFAQLFPDYLPTVNGKLYYEFNCGPIWGLVLDCGEDKYDDYPDYGKTTVFSHYRKKETEFIKNVIKSRNFARQGIKYRLIISHIPFCNNDLGEESNEHPFMIEKETYTEWVNIIRKGISPDLMISAHTHRIALSKKDGPLSGKGQPCTVVIGSAPRFNEDEFSATHIKFHHDNADILVHNISGKELIKENIYLPDDRATYIDD